jgi:uncharacterized membrane protein YdcZ (DUF606 family)
MSVNKKVFVDMVDVVVGVDDEKNKIHISLNRDNAYLFVSGGVSSGKTTFLNRLKKSIEQKYVQSDVQLFEGSLDLLFLEVKRRKQQQDGGSFPLLVCVLDDSHMLLAGSNGRPDDEMNKTFLTKIFKLNAHEVGVVFVFSSSWNVFYKNKSYREYILHHFTTYIFFGGISLKNLFSCTGIPLEIEEDSLKIGHGIVFNSDLYEEPLFFS